jgi:hypothetical protein
MTPSDNIPEIIPYHKWGSGHVETWHLSKKHKYEGHVIIMFPLSFFPEEAGYKPRKVTLFPSSLLC